MSNLYARYGAKRMRTVRASRVDYFTQDKPRVWRDHLGSLGLEGENAGRTFSFFHIFSFLTCHVLHNLITFDPISSVFLNLAAIAGPIPGKPDAMMAINYHAPVAAATACVDLGFGHFVQSSTQATNAERAGQVPYSRAKAMCDFHLSRLSGLPVTICCLGLLYCRTDGIVGQTRKTGKINLIDLALLPLTPVLGDGSAPMQPQEVGDAAERITFLAFADPADRPYSSYRPHIDYNKDPELESKKFPPSKSARFYDAVGPETMSMLDMLSRFAKYHGNENFRPAFIDYRSMEELLNLKSLGNLNRQMVSLLRSEQSSNSPIIGKK